MLEKELKENLISIIEKNFSKAESEALTNLVRERDEFKDLSEKQVEDIASLKETNQSINETNKSLNGRIDKCQTSLSAEIDRCAEFEKNFNEIKKESVEKELTYAKTSLENIFELTKIAFKTPSKIREFETPMVTRSQQGPDHFYEDVRNATTTETLKTE